METRVSQSVGSSSSCVVRENSCNGEKRGLASWHLQHLLVSSNFPRAKPDSPLCEVSASHVAPLCECICEYMGEHVGYIRDRWVHTYARHQVGTRHAAASSRCRGGLHVRHEKPVFNRAAFWKAIVYARYV